MRDKTFITDAPIDVEAALLFVQDNAHGAVTSFVGTVRDHNQGRAVRGINYDVFEPLAEKVFKALCQEVHERWGDQLNIYIAHHHGWLAVGDVSVAVAVGTPHRVAAFEACRYLVEELKHRCPIWKEECFMDGHSEWVKGYAEGDNNR